MELWVTELQTENLKMSARIKETLFAAQSQFQDIAIVDSYEFGRMLVLDGVFQTSIVEEYVYHEMIAHVPLATHPEPKHILVIGGGDGGTVRELVKHPSVENVKMVEIDGMVVEACKKFLPKISEALINKHPKLHLTIGDGIKHMQESENKYDIIIVDCSDPVGPGEGLFTHDFYKNVYKALKPDGMFVQQTESPFYHQSLIKRLYKDVESLFPITRLYLANIPIYPGGMHCFTMGSKKHDPLQADFGRLSGLKLRYLNEQVLKGCFALPNFVQEILK